MKKAVVLEPKGHIDFSLGELLDPIEEIPVVVLLVSGSDELPMVENHEVVLKGFRSMGYELADIEELEDLQEQEPHLELGVDEYVRAAIDLYAELGFEAERIDGVELISPLA